MKYLFLSNYIIKRNHLTKYTKFMGDPSKLSPGFYFADKFFGFIIFKNKSKNTIKKRIILNQVQIYM